MKKRYVPDLVADMAECDANYIRLRRLFPAMDDENCLEFGVDNPGQFNGSDSVVSRTANDGAVVTIRIERRCPYTTMLAVTVESDEDKPWVKWPSLEVRMYNDIRSAEVTSFERHRNLKFRYVLPNDQMYQPDEKSQINRYFGELLTFCHEHGHNLEDVMIRQPL